MWVRNVSRSLKRKLLFALPEEKNTRRNHIVKKKKENMEINTIH